MENIVEVRTDGIEKYVPIREVLLTIGYSRSSYSVIKTRAAEGTIKQFKTENGKKQYIKLEELIKILPKLDRRDIALESFLYRTLRIAKPTEVIEQTFFDRDDEREGNVIVEINDWKEEEIEPSEIITIDTNEDGEATVNGRSLHKGLMVQSDYRHWIKRMIGYGFIDGVDFRSFLTETHTTGRPQENHILTLDMAKEIAMIQRSDQGRKVRQYFIQVEKDYNSPEKVMARALKIANKEIEGLLTLKEYQTKQIEELKPKALFAEAVEDTEDTILIGDLAKLLKQNGVNIGQNNLFEWLRNNGYLISRKGSSWNMPTQRAMDLKIFRVIETAITTGKGIKTRMTTKVTGKGQRYFIDKFLSENN